MTCSVMAKRKVETDIKLPKSDSSSISIAGMTSFLESISVPNVQRNSGVLLQFLKHMSLLSLEYSNKDFPENIVRVNGKPVLDLVDVSDENICHALVSSFSVFQQWNEESWKVKKRIASINNSISRKIQIEIKSEIFDDRSSKVQQAHYDTQEQRMPDMFSS